MPARRGGRTRPQPVPVAVGLTAEEEADKRVQEALLLDVLGAGKTDHDAEEERRKKLIEARILNAHGGFQDWVFLSGNLVLEVIDALEEESDGLRHLLETSRANAEKLDDQKWKKFQEVPRRCVHADDHRAYSALFTAAEPSWKTLLSAPKRGPTCVFLHIGTEPPSLQVLQFLTKLGWFGVVVSQTPPTEGNEDRVTHCKLDPFSEEDEDALLSLQYPKGSRIEKPAYFKLAMADIVWDADNVDGISREAAAFDQMDVNNDGRVSNNEFKRAVELGLIPQDIGFKVLDVNKDGSITREEYVQAVKQGLVGEEAKLAMESRAKEELPENACGYGIVGPTFSPNVRKRLRVMTNIVTVALQRLANQGTLVITWHGIPHHPALMFLTAQLRPVFLRVHVLVSEGTRSWEIYILCSSFKRQEAEEVASKGGGGNMFKSFVDNAFRSADLDDALLWTLTAQQLLQEYRLAGVAKDDGKRTIAKGYNEMWTYYAHKCRKLTAEIIAGRGTTPAPKPQRPRNVQTPTAGNFISGGDPYKEKAMPRRGKSPPKSAGPGRDRPKSAAPPKSAESRRGAEPESPLRRGAESPSRRRGPESPSRRRAEKTKAETPKAETSKAEKPKAPKPNTEEKAGRANVVDRLVVETNAETHWAQESKTQATASPAALLPNLAESLSPASPVRWAESFVPKQSPVRSLTRWRPRNLQPSRSLPALSCSFGGVAGGPVGRPSPLVLSGYLPIVQQALQHLERNSQIVGPITDRHQMLHAAAMTNTKKYRECDEGERAGDVYINDIIPPTPKDDPYKKARKAKKSSCKSVETQDERLKRLLGT